MLRYEPEEKCPPTLALVSALQTFVPNTISVILLATLIVRASHQSEAYLDWVVFSGLALCGLSTILHSFQFWRFGSARLVVTNFNVPFLGDLRAGARAGRAWSARQPDSSFDAVAVPADGAAGVAAPDIHADCERNGGDAGGGLGGAVHRGAVGGGGAGHFYGARPAARNRGAGGRNLGLAAILARVASVDIAYHGGVGAGGGDTVRAVRLRGGDRSAAGQAAGTDLARDSTLPSAYTSGRCCPPSYS